MLTTSRKTDRIFNKFPETGYFIKYKLHARFILCVYTLITFFFFLSYQTVYRRFTLYLSSQQIHIIFHPELLDQCERNKFFLSKNFFYSPRDIMAIEESRRVLFRIPPSQISPSLTTVYTFERLHASTRACIVEVGTL